VHSLSTELYMHPYYGTPAILPLPLIPLMHYDYGHLRTLHYHVRAQQNYPHFRYRYSISIRYPSPLKLNVVHVYPVDEMGQHRLPEGLYPLSAYHQQQSYSRLSAGLPSPPEK
jgi:hypothetical protein